MALICEYCGSKLRKDLSMMRIILSDNPCGDCEGISLHISYIYTMRGKALKIREAVHECSDKVREIGSLE